MKNAANKVADKLGTVQDVFQKGFNLAAAETDFALLKAQLDTSNNEFLSIAYEGASMSLAIGCLEAGSDITPWIDFLNLAAAPHATQYHIGLGWALGQLQADITPFLQQLDAVDRYRVPDGYGYYEAIFRTKRCIHNQQSPPDFNSAALSAYYQGIGRGIWYISAGRMNAAQEMINRFQVEPRADLWRGVGIACSYAGGFDEALLKEVIDVAGDYRKQLASGAVMVAICRHNAGFMSADTALACKIWCKQNAADLVLLHKLSDEKIKSDNVTGYLDWILGIESSF